MDYLKESVGTSGVKSGYPTKPQLGSCGGITSGAK